MSITLTVTAADGAVNHIVLSDPNTNSAPPLIPCLKGVSEAGGENRPGIRVDQGGTRVYVTDYLYVQNDELDYFASKGFGIIRLEFDICRMYPIAYGTLDATELGLVRPIIAHCLQRGMRVMLDAHNYGRMYDSRLGGGLLNSIIGVTAGSADLFADFWSKMADEFKDDTNVWFSLMNEPTRSVDGQTAQVWKDAAAQAVTAIRAAGFTATIGIQGIGYSHPNSWISGGNAAAWDGFSDANFMFEWHQYLDSDLSGTHNTCSIAIASQMDTAIAWMRARGYTVMVSEFAWSTHSSCVTLGPDVVDYMDANGDVIRSWTWSNAGNHPWFDSYMFTLWPGSYSSPVDKPQMARLVTSAALAPEAINFIPPIIDDIATVGTVVGTASLMPALTYSGNPVWALDNDAGGKFSIDSSTGVVTVAAEIIGGFYPIVISVSGITPAVLTRSTSVQVRAALVYNALGHAVSGTDSSSYTFIGKALGPASGGNKFIIGSAEVRRGGTAGAITGVTVDGIAATLGTAIINTTGGGNTSIQFFIADLSADANTIGNIVVTCNQTMVRCGIQWGYTVNGGQPAIIQESGDLTISGGVFSAGIDAPARGFVLAAIYDPTNAVGATAWSLSTENGDEFVDGTNLVSQAFENFSAASPGMTITATVTGDSASGVGAMKVAAIAPRL